MCSAALCTSSAEELFIISQFWKICGFSRIAFSREGFGTNSLSQNLGFASSLWEGAFGIAGKFPTKVQSLRECPLPLGGAVA